MTTEILTPGPGRVRTSAVEVDIGGVTFTGTQIIAVSTQSETASPLTDAIRRASSSAGAEATITLADPGFALSPWRRSDTLVGQRVQIWAGPDYRSMATVFVGVVMTASGQATSNEVELTCLDRAAWFMRDTGMRAGPVEGSALWVIDQIAQHGGYGATPAPIRTWPNVRGRCEASMLGSTAPNYGTIVPLRPEVRWAQFDIADEPGRGEVMTHGSAAYMFDYATAEPQDHAFYLQVYGDFAGLRDRYVTPNTVRASDYDGPYFQIHTAWRRTGQADVPSYLRLYPYMDGSYRPRWGVVPEITTVAGDEYLIDIPHVPGMGIRLRLHDAHQTGGELRVSTSAGYSQAISLGTTVLPNVSAEPRLVFHLGWMERDRRGTRVSEEPVGWQQGAFAHGIGTAEALPDAPEWIDSIPGGVDYSPSLSQLRYHPDLDHGWEHIQSAAQSEGGAAWVTRDGVLTFRNREDLLYGRAGDEIRTVDSYADITALSWEQSVTDVARSVEVTHRPVSVPRPRYIYHADDVKEITGDDLADGDGAVEEEISLENFIVLDLETGLFTNTRFRPNPFRPGQKSYYAAYYRAAGTSDEEDTRGARLDITAEIKDSTTILLRYRNPRKGNPEAPDPEEDSWFLAWQADPDTPKLSVWAPNAIRLGEEMVITAPGRADTTRDQPALAIHAEEHNEYRQDVDYVHAFALFLAGQYSSRAPITDGLEIVPDDTLKLGQSIIVREPSRTNLDQRMVILAEQRDMGASGISHSITAAPMLWRFTHGDIEDIDYWQQLIAGNIPGIPFATGPWSLEPRMVHGGQRALKCNGTGEIVLTEARPVPRSRRVVFAGWARGMGAPLMSDIDWTQPDLTQPPGNLDRGQGTEVRLDALIQTRTSAETEWETVDYYRLYDDRVAEVAATETYGRWRGFGAPARPKIRVDADRAFFLGNDAHQWRAVLRCAANDFSPEAYWVVDDIDLREV